MVLAITADPYLICGKLGLYVFFLMNGSPRFQNNDDTTLSQDTLGVGLSILPQRHTDTRTCLSSSVQDSVLQDLVGPQLSLFYLS